MIGWLVSQGWDLLEGKQFGKDVNLRVIEYSHYLAPAGLDQPTNHDTGSLLTIDMMLSESQEFEGGQFNTVEDSKLIPQEFAQVAATHCHLDISWILTQVTLTGRCDSFCFAQVPLCVPAY